MLQEQFEILGFYAEDIYFELEGKLIIISNKLPKQHMILRLKVEPEDVKPLRDEILVQASKKHLTYTEKEEIIKKFK